MIEPIARVRIELQDIEPKVWCRVDVPLSSTLLALHDIVQITFSWTGSHLFEFEVGERIYGEPDVDYPAFVGGERRGPPEDVGGTSGFMEFLEAMLNPLHEEHESVMHWYGKRFEPDDIDERWVRLRLEMVAGRRRGPLMSHRGSARRRRA